MAGIMDMFRGITQPSAAAPAVGQPLPNPADMPQPGNIPPNAAQQTASTVSPGTAPNGAVPAGTAAVAAASPLDSFADLWKTDPNATPAQNQPYFNVNMEALSKAASSQDFTASITPEQLQAIAGGGEGAMKAFAEALNTASRDVYAKSAFATTKIVESALAKAEDKFKASVPGMIKQHTVSDSLRTENPAFAHPAAQPLISALESQLTVKFPNATAAELRTMATNYLSAFATASVPAPANTEATKKTPGEIDWSTFVS